MMTVFACKMCGDCCYGEGGIYLEHDEKDRIARFLGMPTSEFLNRFCEKKHGRIYLTTGEHHFCVFYDKGKGCRIHPVKPARCALWPYYPANVRDEETWEMAKLACPGLNRECLFAEFVREARIACRDNDPLQSETP